VVTNLGVGVDVDIGSFWHSCKVRFYLPLVNAEVHEGDHVLFMANISGPSERRNPFDFDELSYFKNLGVVGVAQDVNLFAVDHSAHYWFPFTRFQIKNYVRSRIEERFEDEETRALVTALILSDRSSLSSVTRKAFQNTGLAHLLAISGLHFGVLAAFMMGLVMLLLRRVPFSIVTRRYVAAFLIVVLLVVYAWIISSSPSVRRALLMATLGLVAWARGTRSSLFLILLKSFLFFLAIDPSQIENAGFLLSFSAVAGIGTALRLSRTRWFLLQKRARSSLIFSSLLAVWISLFATVFTAPVILYFIGFIPLITLLLSPFSIVLTSLSMMAGVTTLLFPVSFDGLAQISSLLFQGLLVVVNESSQLSFIPIWYATSGHFNHWAVVPVVLLTALAFLPTNLRARFLIRSSLAVLLLISLRTRDLFHASFLDVGQGDAAIFWFRGFAPLVIDVGTRSSTGRTVYRHMESIAPRSFLPKSAPYKIVLSHPHKDHIGGLPIVKKLAVENLGAPNFYVHDTDWFDDSEIESSPLWRGDSINIFPHTRVYVLHPPQRSVEREEFGNNLNNESIVLLVIYGQTQFLLLGDIEKEAESKLVNDFEALLGVTVVKAAHHGSKTSSTLGLVKSTTPQFVLISAGDDNRFSHPDLEVVERWHRAGAHVSVTAKTGAVKFFSDGHKVTRNIQIISDQ